MKRLSDVFPIQVLLVNAIRSLLESGLRLPAADNLQEHITRIDRCCGIVGHYWIGIAQAVGSYSFSEAYSILSQESRFQALLRRH
jgi:hypothetical protein